MRTATLRSILSSAAAIGAVLLAALLVTPSDSRTAIAAPEIVAAGSGCEAALDGVLRLMPTSIAGLSRTRARIRNTPRMTGIDAVYEGEAAGAPRLEVIIGHGIAARGFVRDQMVAQLRSSETFVETDVDGVPVMEGVLGDRAVLAAYVGSFVVVLSAPGFEGGDADRGLDALEEAFGRLHHLMGGGDSSAPVQSDDVAVRCTADWGETSFGFRLPEGWAVADLTLISQGMLENVVLMSDRDVANQQFGPEMSFATGDTLSLGSARNVTVSLSAAPVDPSAIEAGATPGAAAFLDDLRESGFVEAMLPGGETTGEVETRTIEGAALLVLPYRGRDREGLEVRGWLSGLEVGESLILGHLMAGPEAPPAALESGWRILASVSPETSGP